MVHYGLLVARVREFVSYVASEIEQLPPSIGSKESIQLLPTVMEMIKPAFCQDDYRLLERALDQVTMAREAVDRFHYSVWGTVSDEAGKFGRTEYRQYKGAGCWRDHDTYTTSEVHKLAMEISLAMKFLGKVHGVLQRKLAENSSNLRKKLNRQRL